MEKGNFQKEFEKLFRQMAGKYSGWDVWNDFLIMSALSISNVVNSEKWEEREAEYRSRIGRYPKEMQDKFPELLSLLVSAMDENPEQDFLGSTYHRLNLQQRQKGQFFTPYHVSELMAEISVKSGEDLKEEIRRKGFISVNDSCCGAGVMLIAFANVARKRGINYQNEVLFVAQDIDRTAALMCYLQLSVLGCPAVVIVGNSLLRPGLHPENEVWYTPFYHLNRWRFQGAWEEAITVNAVQNASPREGKDDRLVLKPEDAA